MSFELIDNLLQVAALGGASLAAAAAAVRRGDRRCLILALAYACFAMGTLFYVLHLAIIGTVPKVFYVSEVSWLAAYLFFLSLQILRTETIAVRFSWLPALGALLAAVAVLVVRIMGPSYLVSALFALTVGAIVYLSAFRLLHAPQRSKLDACLLLCVTLQVLLYLVSVFMSDYTRFNLYFAVDLALTASLIALLPLTLREVPA